jgi:hypothetical protein
VTSRLHGEHDDSDGPTVDEVVVALVVLLKDDLWREVARRPAHGLAVNVSGWNAGVKHDTRTRSMVILSTALAKPKSATLMCGGLSFVRRIFYRRVSVRQRSGICIRDEPLA